VLLRSPVSAGHRLTAVGCPPQESRKALEAQLAGMQATNDSLVGELKAARDEVLSSYLDQCFALWAQPRLKFPCMLLNVGECGWREEF